MKNSLFPEARAGLKEAHTATVAVKVLLPETALKTTPVLAGVNPTV
jgi:hypothetical protein